MFSPTIIVARSPSDALAVKLVDTLQRFKGECHGYMIVEEAVVAAMGIADGSLSLSCKTAATLIAEFEMIEKVHGEYKFPAAGVT